MELNAGRDSMTWVARVLAVLALASCIESAYLTYSIITHPPLITPSDDPHLLTMQALWCAATVLFGGLAYGYMRRRKWSLVLTTVGLAAWLLFFTYTVPDLLRTTRPSDYLFFGAAVTLPTVLWGFLVKFSRRIFDT